MVLHRTARIKGSQFEYDVLASLQQKYPDMVRTYGPGIVRGYDLISHQNALCIECKRIKSMSWSTMIGYLEKLYQNSPRLHKCILIVKSNHQPVLVAHYMQDRMVVTEFETYFDIPFIKHEPVRKHHEQKAKDMYNH